MKILRITAGILLAACAAIALFLPHAQNPGAFPAPSYKGIITLWQTDSFEGGTGSRKSFLLKAARGFEKENEGVLVTALSYTAETAREHMKNGSFPDLISYGAGTEPLNVQPLNKKSYAAGGRVENSVYAVPWCRGGYCLIIREGAEIKDNFIRGNLIVSQGEYTQPVVALELSGYSAESYRVLPPKEAYAAFTGGKDGVMLGTQRDIVRLSNIGFQFGVIPLTGFNDLYQYISVTGESAEKNVYAEMFIDYLLSSAVQEDLGALSMFSVYGGVSYADEKLAAMQRAECGKTISAFLSADQLKGMQELSLAAAKEGKELPEEIKNLLL